MALWWTQIYPFLSNHSIQTPLSRCTPTSTFPHWRAIHPVLTQQPLLHPQMEHTAHRVCSTNKKASAQSTERRRKQPPVQLCNIWSRVKTINMQIFRERTISESRLQLHLSLTLQRKATIKIYFKSLLDPWIAINLAKMWGGQCLTRIPSLWIHAHPNCRILSIVAMRGYLGPSMAKLIGPVSIKVTWSWELQQIRAAPIWITLTSIKK